VTLIQLPVAFCAGINEKALPVPASSQVDWLSNTQILELRLFKVSVHPNLVYGDDRHQCYARADPLPNLNVAFGHQA
jgi:hypothetical protein